MGTLLHAAGEGRLLRFYTPGYERSPHCCAKPDTHLLSHYPRIWYSRTISLLNTPPSLSRHSSNRFIKRILARASSNDLRSGFFLTARLSTATSPTTFPTTYSQCIDNNYTTPTSGFNISNATYRSRSHVCSLSTASRGIGMT